MDHKLAYLLSYHKNLSEQVKSDNFNYIGINRTINKIRAVEGQIEKILEVEPEEVKVQ